MPWIVSGSCIGCGACCKPPVMLENPCIVRGQDRCLFYTDDVDNTTKFGHCLIMQANRNYNRVRDRFGNKITAEQIVWFEHNCPQFPAANLAELMAGAFELPPTCNYTLTWVD